MRLKEYISPEFQWMKVNLIEDALTGSDYPEQDDGDEPDDGGDKSAEGGMNEATSPPDLDWGNDWSNW